MLKNIGLDHLSEFQHLCFICVRLIIPESDSSPAEECAITTTNATWSFFQLWLLFRFMGASIDWDIQVVQVAANSSIVILNIVDVCFTLDFFL